jgi:peptidoglycan/LPS O-acetylase OafA/YrhL
MRWKRRPGTDGLQYFVGVGMTRYDRPELDALRFIAFVLVLSFHLPDDLPLAMGRPWIADVLTTGAFGAPVFFLLSTFLITELLAREREACGAVNVMTFYGRRLLRIWPLYFAVLGSDGPAALVAGRGIREARSARRLRPVLLSA